MKKRIGLLLFTIGVVLFFILGYFFYSEKYQSRTHLFTEAEIEQFTHLEGQTFKFGFASGHEINFMFSFKQLFYNTFNINLEFVMYDSLEDVKEALINNEIDLLIDLSSSEKIKNTDGLTLVSAPFPSTQFIITNVNAPLNSKANLAHSRLGFIANSLIYEDFSQTIGSNHRKDDFEVTFFNGTDHILDALVNQEIDAFITRTDQIIEQLISRPELQIEYIFQNNIINANFALIDEESDFNHLIATFATHLGDDNLRESFVDAQFNHIEGLIKTHIQENFSPIIEEYTVINIAHHNSNFPFSYFESNGKSSGLAMDKLNLFQTATGIQYVIQNDSIHTNFSYLFDKLTNNDIQFLFGIGNEMVFDEIVPIGNFEQRNDIISIEMQGNNTDRKSIIDLEFGIVSTPELAASILNTNEFKNFPDYNTGIAALIEGTIDVLIAKENVLAYYRDVMGHTDLRQTNHIYRISSHGVLGNIENEDLNSMMAEIIRLYGLLHLEDDTVRRTNQVTTYQQRYLQLQKDRSIQLTFNIVSISVLLISLLLFSLIKKERERRKKEWEFERDKLTGLYNRDAYEKLCHQLIKKHPNKLGVFYFFDLDDVKSCNDTYGHLIGDQFIAQFGQNLKKLMDDDTICFRISGDEFGLFKMGFNNRDSIEDMIPLLANELKSTLIINNETILPIYFSGGGSIYNLDTTNFSELKHFADLAMYQAKREKKKMKNVDSLFSNIKLFDATSFEMNADFLLETILNEKQFHSLYQSINTVQSGEVLGYESFTRANNPQLPNIIQLITIAEAKGRLRELDLMMMESSVKNFNGTGKLFLNVEYKTPEYIEEYIEKMVALTKESGRSPEDIVIEVCERNQWSQQSLKTLNQLKQKYKFLTAADDYGAGFANNYLLLHLKPDFVKLDKNLVDGIDKDKDKFEHLKALVDFIHAHHMTLIFEGIETQDELNALRQISQDYAQGYYFEKPKKHK